MPKISVMDGSPMSRADLRSVKVNLCGTCVILSAKVRIISTTSIVTPGLHIRLQTKQSQSWLIRKL